MVDQEVLASQLKTDRFPFPSEGDITLAVRNSNHTLGPVMLHINMKPGAVIPPHQHKGMAEALYVVEGDLINEGKPYPAGTSLHFKAGRVHGPHATKNGCKLLALGRSTHRTSLPTSVTSLSKKRWLSRLATDPIVIHGRRSEGLRH